MWMVTESMDLISSTAQTPLAQPPSSSSQLHRMHTCSYSQTTATLYILGFLNDHDLQEEGCSETATALNCLLLFENGNFNVTFWTRDLLFISFFKVYFGRYVLTPEMLLNGAKTTA